MQIPILIKKEETDCIGYTQDVEVLSGSTDFASPVHLALLSQLLQYIIPVLAVGRLCRRTEVH